MNDTNAIIDAWMNIPDRIRNSRHMPDYTTDARLIQPMLDRCREVGWQVDFGFHTIERRDDGIPTGDLVHAFVWSEPYVITDGHAATLSEALTQAIVEMIEATSRGENDE